MLIHGQRRQKHTALLGLWFSILFMLLPSLFSQDAETVAIEHYHAGQLAQKNGQYDTAVREYLQVLAVMPQQAEVYASLGLAYNSENRFQDSAQALRKADALKPSLAGVSLFLGIDLVKLNQPAKALPYLRQALRGEPHNEQTWLWFAEALKETDQPEEAIAELRAAERIFPQDPVLIYRTGSAYRSMADSKVEDILVAASGQPLVHQVYGDIYKDEQLWVKAEGHYQRALSLDPTWHGAHLALAQIALSQDQLDDADREFQQESKLDSSLAPQRAEAYAGMAQIALLKHDTSAAISLLNEAIRISPAAASFALGLPFSRPDQDFHLSEEQRHTLRNAIPDILSSSPGVSRDLALAFVYAQTGPTSDSMERWEKYRKSMPTMNAFSAYQRAMRDYDLGEFDAAADAVREWLKTNRRDLSAAYLLSKTYRQLSLLQLGQLLAVAPDSYSAHQLKAETYENAEDDEHAIEQYRVVERMAPDLPGIHYALGRLLRKTGDIDDALREMKIELEQNPNEPRANGEIGAIYVERSEENEGIRYLKDALEHEPDIWEAHRQLGEAYFKQGRFSLAEAELQKAIMHDQDGSTHYQLGLVYRQMGHAADARTMFADAERIKADRLANEGASHGTSETLQ